MTGLRVGHGRRAAGTSRSTVTPERARRPRSVSARRCDHGEPSRVRATPESTTSTARRRRAARAARPIQVAARRGAITPPDTDRRLVLDAARHAGRSVLGALRTPGRAPSGGARSNRPPRPRPIATSTSNAAEDDRPPPIGQRRSDRSADRWPAVRRRRARPAPQRRRDQTSPGRARTSAGSVAAVGRGPAPRPAKSADRSSHHTGVGGRRRPSSIDRAVDRHRSRPGRRGSRRAHR